MKRCHTVVVIDDDGDLRDLVAALLSQAGYRVDATGDSRHGVDVVRKERPDLVLCDISMPEMDGYAVVHALQADPDTRDVPVAFLTARREFTDRVRAFRSGVVDYITKPVTADTLLSRVNDILRGAKVRSQAPDGRPSLFLESATPAPSSFAEPSLLHDDIAVHEASEQGDPFRDLPMALREIVIADDDILFRSTLAAVFARHGFKVREAADGLETVSRVLERPPILLLVDVRMPVLDGFEVCRRLRRHALTRRLPIVFLSGFDEVRDRATGLEAGADEFLSKRTSLRELLVRVQLQLQRYSRPAAESDSALKGRIESLGAPGVLQFCLLSTLTGTLTATAGSRLVSMGFKAGHLVSADSESAHGREAVFEFVGWDQGTFAFVKGMPYTGAPVRESLSALVLEGCRRIDGRNPEPPGLPARGAARA